MERDPFRIGISSDFQMEASGILEPYLQDYFAPISFIHTEYFTGTQGKIVPAQTLNDFDAIITLRPRYTLDSLLNNTRLTLIARWGAGYDTVDVSACTHTDILLTTTGNTVARPVAEAIITLFLALGKKLFLNDRLARTGQWDLKAHASGLGFHNKVFGSVGLGNIASHMFSLLMPFEPARLLAYDPYVSPERGITLGIELVDLDTLFQEADFVAINCALTDETRGMINRDVLSRMKASAYLINTARGAIVNQDDLLYALQRNQIAGAGLDVFVQEPLPTDHPFTALENVILSPHSLAWTDELYRGNSTRVCENILAVLQGKIPNHVINTGVIDKQGFQRKLQNFHERWTQLTHH